MTAARLRSGSRAPPCGPAGDVAPRVLAAAQRLARACRRLAPVAPVVHCYHPLTYAWAVHQAYVERWGASPRRVLLLGMNPGPFGMAQTGVPFGDVTQVRTWLGLSGTIRAPRHQHPRRPILGWACARAEVSGTRLWGSFARHFGSPEAFFAEHFIANYCPVAFLAASGANRTPDQLPAAMRAAVLPPCDAHLRAVVAALGCAWVVGIGAFAAARAREVLAGQPVRIATILHPSPASPLANRDWFGTIHGQLIAQGVWSADPPLRPSR